MDYVDDNWPFAQEYSDESPTLRKGKNERKKADAYLQDLADEKANRVRWAAPPQFCEEPAMTTKPLPPAKMRKEILSERVAGPEERLFGGKGIVIPFRFNIPDKDEPIADE